MLEYVGFLVSKFCYSKSTTKLWKRSCSCLLAETGKIPESTYLTQNDSSSSKKISAKIDLFNFSHLHLCTICSCAYFRISSHLQKICFYKKEMTHVILSLKIAFEQGNYFKSHWDNFSWLSLKSSAIITVTQVSNWVCVTAFIMLDLMQGLLKIWTWHSHWFLLNPKPL